MDLATGRALLKDLRDAIDVVLAGAPPVVIPPPVDPPPVVGAGPDPLKLPVATTTQRPNVSAYNALNVPTLAAGKSYADPVTGVKVYRLTASTFPASASSWGHDYAEGGDEISLPHTGTTRTILTRNLQTNAWWLLDFTPGVGVSKPRQLTGTLAPWIDIAFTFSSNPATPYFAYVANYDTIRRFDVRSMKEVPGNGWPMVDKDAGQEFGFPIWLHQSMNDEFFCWLRGANGPTTVGYMPGTATLKARLIKDGREPRVDRAGRYIGVSRAVPDNSLVLWDWQTDTVTWTTQGMAGTDPISQIPFAHNASLRRRWAGMQYNMNFPPPFWSYDPSTPTNSGKILTGGSGPGIPEHCCGNWVQPNAPLDDQWALCYMYGALETVGFPGVQWLAPGHIMLFTPNGQRRALAHPYNTATDYGKLSFAKFSPDGRYVMFTSNMNGQARSDVFLAELPV